MHTARIFGLFLAGFWTLSATVIGCSSSSSSGGAGASDASAGGSDGAGAETHDASGTCVPPGTPNNELGVGGYCDKSTDCPGALCTALFGAPDG